MGPDLVVVRGRTDAPTASEVEVLYREASRDAPLSEPPEVAAAFASLYDMLLARPDVVTVSVREAEQLAGFAYGHPWHLAEQDDPWAAQLRGRLGVAAGRRPIGHGPDAPNGKPGLVLLHD